MLCPVLEKGISLNFLSGVLQTQPNLAQQHCHPSLPSLSPWRIRQTSRKDAVPSFRSLRRARHCAQERVQETPLVTRGQLSESPMVSLGSDFSVARAPEPVPHPVIRQQVAEALRGRAREGAPHSWAGGSSSGFQSSAPAPPRPAPRSAPGAPRRPPPAPASAPSALPAATAAAAATTTADSLTLSAADAPGPCGECAPVPDPSPDVPGPLDSGVPLLNPASSKMNVRRVESISAQLEEASSTGGRMQYALEGQPHFNPPSLASWNRDPFLGWGCLLSLLHETVTWAGLRRGGGSGGNGGAKKKGCMRGPGQGRRGV